MSALLLLELLFTPTVFLQQGVLNRLEVNFASFVESGFEALKPEYLSKWLHSQQRIVLEENEPQSCSGEKRKVPLTVQGLTDSGYLLATDDCGSKYELHPDGNR